MVAIDDVNNGCLLFGFHREDAGVGTVVRFPHEYEKAFEGERQSIGPVYSPEPRKVVAVGV